MLNTQGSINLGKDIFLYKNFIDQEYTDLLFSRANDLKEWISHGSHSTTGGGFSEILPFVNKLNELVSFPDILDDSCYFQKYTSGQGMGQHQDNNKVLEDMEKSKLYVDGDKYNLVRQPTYGVVLYLNKVDGGDIYYTEQDIRYSPSPGDMVVHSAEKHCTHMVEKLISDIRLCVPTYIYQEIKVPL